jgi:hypothetical protein
LVIYRTTWNICHDDNRAKGWPRISEAVSLDRGVFFRFAWARNRETQVAELHTQGLSCYPEQEGGLLEIAVGVLHNALQ